MQVTQEQLNPCEIELKFELDAADYQAGYERVFWKVAGNVSIPGFRKGKAPRQLLERHVDVDKIRGEAADDLIRGAYVSTVEKEGLDPIAPASVEMVEDELGGPLVFKAVVPLAPQVELGEYVGLEVERKAVQVTDEMVDAEVESFRRRHAEYPEISDRPAAQGDIVVIETRDESEENADSKRDVARIGDMSPEFDAALVGMSAGEEKVVDLKYPDDHPSEEVRGKTVPLRTTLVELREEKLPELTDEWVQQLFLGSVPEGTEPPPDAVDTVDKLKQNVRTQVEAVAQREADEAVRRELIRLIVEGSTVHFPKAMVDERVAKRFEDLVADLKRRQATIDDFLRETGRTIDQLSDEFAESARSGLTTGLVVSEIVAKEGIKIEESDTDAELSELAAARGITPASARAMLDKIWDKEAFSNRILYKKTIDFLVHASNIKNVSVDAEGK